MDIIFLEEGTPLSVVPILTLIEHKSEFIVGCVLLGEDDNHNLPSWFIDSRTAAQVLEHVNARQVLKELDVFLVVREPNSLLQINVLAAIDCCNLNYSGGGGNAGRRVLELLAKHNIRTYPAEIKRPTYEYQKSRTEWRKEMKEAFEDAFSIVADKWLPQSWGLERTTLIS